MQDFTQEQVGKALANLGRYRVQRAQIVANEGSPDGISGALIMALGLRETHLRNIEGGAMLVDGKWVAQTDYMKMDVGWTQINRGYHYGDLKLMPGVKSGTWGPVVSGMTAGDKGYCMRFEDSLRWTITNMQEAIAYAEDKDIPEEDRVRYAIAAHNGGLGGALRGYREGNVDKYTTGGDYSAFVLRHRTLVNRWLGSHPNWKP